MTAPRVTLLLAVLCWFAVLAGDAGAAPASMSAVKAVQALERPLIRKLNRVRGAHGLKPLRKSVPLRRAAAAHASAMSGAGFFSHTSLDGTAMEQRVARFYRRTSFSSWKVGENLLWASGSMTADRAVEVWMNSPGHRRNILDPRFREIGIAAVAPGAAAGVFPGPDVTIVATNFGARSG
jgi:uncharacterized protein YkwD